MSDAGSSPTPRLRYVVLHHTGWGKPHFDLMIEPYPTAGRLSTWQAFTWPLAEGAALAPLPPHRRVYLEFEGPLSCGRGNVRRVAEGLCRMTHTAQGVVIRLDDSSEAWVLGEVANRVDARDSPLARVT